MPAYKFAELIYTFWQEWGGSGELFAKITGWLLALTWLFGGIASKDTWDLIISTSMMLLVIGSVTKRFVLLGMVQITIELKNGDKLAFEVFSEFMFITGLWVCATSISEMTSLMWWSLLSLSIFTALYYYVCCFGDKPPKRDRKKEASELLRKMAERIKSPVSLPVPT